MKNNSIVQYRYWVRIISIALLLLVFIFCIFSWPFIYVESKSENVQFCLNNSCIENFLSRISSLVKLFIFVWGVIAALFAWLTIEVYVHTYISTHENNLNAKKVSAHNTYLSHYNFFCDLVDCYIEKSRLVSKKSIDKLVLYNFIFKTAHLGDFDVSQDYKDVLESLNFAIEQMNVNLKRKQGYDLHAKGLVNECKKLGIGLTESERKDFSRIEMDIYNLLNNINNINNILKCRELTRPKYIGY